MITLIATVLNEGGSIRHLMDSIKKQTRQPDEIVIVDGGSQDDTLDIMRSCRAQLPLRLLVVEGCNISQGRNHALAAARGDIIAVTDAGVRLADDWLENITRPLLDRPDLNGVGGFFQADPQTSFEAALGAATLPLENEIDPQAFLPSSRSAAFRKTAAEAVGGYPEWLDFCEDVVFDRRLRAKAGPFAFAPGALAHFRPRRSLAAFGGNTFSMPAATARRGFGANGISSATASTCCWRRSFFCWVCWSARCSGHCMRWAARFICGDPIGGCPLSCADSRGLRPRTGCMAS